VVGRGLAPPRRGWLGPRRQTCPRAAFLRRAGQFRPHTEASGLPRLVRGVRARIVSTLQQHSKLPRTRQLPVWGTAHVTPARVASANVRYATMRSNPVDSFGPVRPMPESEELGNDLTQSGSLASRPGSIKPIFLATLGAPIGTSLYGGKV
jgi:hypothetical protein